MFTIPVFYTRYILCALLCCSAFSAKTQNVPCQEYAHIVVKLKKTYDNGNGNMDQCLKLVGALRACDPQSTETQQWATKVYDRIKEQKQKAESERKKADKERLKAEKEREKARKAEVAAKKDRSRADSTSKAARVAAQHAYADDLASKSQIALREGDRTSAFRLAEFAHRYVDSNNYQVTRALLEALYYNDHPETSHRLPWVSNLQGNGLAVHSIAFSPDGHRLATTATDGTVTLWELDCEDPPKTLRVHEEQVYGVTFSPDGRFLATASADSTVRIWNVRDGKMEKSPEKQKGEVNSVAFAPDSRRLAFGCDDNTARIWDLDSNRVVRTLEGHRNIVTAVTFSPNGKNLATAACDSTAIIWNLDSMGQTLILKGHEGNVNGLAFSRDGSRLATGSDDFTTRIWSVKTGRLIKTLEEHEAAVTSVAFSRNGERMVTASADYTLKMWDIKSAKVVMDMRGHTDIVNSVVFSPDGIRLATGSDDGITKIWEIGVEKAVTTRAGYTTDGGCSVFSPDGKAMAIASRKEVEIWDLDNNKTIRKFPTHKKQVTSMCFSPESEQIAVGYQDGTTKIWHIKSNKLALNLRGGGKRVSNLVFSPDGGLLAAVNETNLIVWELDATGANTTIVEYNAPIRDIAFTGSGSRVAVTFQQDSINLIADLRTLKDTSLMTDGGQGIAKIIFLPDGRRAMTISKEGENDQNSSFVEIKDFASNKVQNKLRGHTAQVLNMALSPNGKEAATTSEDGTVRLWNIENGKEIAAVYALGNEIKSIAFSPDGTRLLTADDANQVKIWEIKPDGAIQTVLKNQRRLAGLTVDQLIKYGFENLLDQQRSNESILIATKNSQQIATFAELYAQQADNSDNINLTNPYYVRAARLYLAAENIQKDRRFFPQMGRLYADWATDIMESPKPDHARGYIDTACQYMDSMLLCRDLWSKFAQKTHAETKFEKYLSEENAEALHGYGDFFFEINDRGKAFHLYEKAEDKLHDQETLKRLYDLSSDLKKPFDFQRFLRSGDAYELGVYGDFFFQKEKWEESRQLYEKAESIVHSATTLLNLLHIGENMGQPFDFQRCLLSEDPDELYMYGNFFFDKEKWEEARQLYEKAENINHSTATSLNLLRIAERTGQPFDFQRCLLSEDPGELYLYGDFFFEKEKWEEARQLYEKAENIKHSRTILPNLLHIAERTGQPFDFQRFLRSGDPAELHFYGDFFFEKEKWEEARQLYEKAERIEHDSRVLIRLFEIAQKTRQFFDFNRFLNSDYMEDLREYGDFFFEKEDWDKARQLYKEAEKRSPDADIVEKLFLIAEKSGQPFDFGHLIASDDPDALRAYGDFFSEKEKWEEARQLYEKAGKIEQNDAETLKKQYVIGEKTGKPFDIHAFTDSNDQKELQNYGQFFYEQGKWEEARILYEKSNTAQSDPTTAVSLYNIALKTGKAADFTVFTNSSDAYTLDGYANAFKNNGLQLSGYKTQIPELTNSLLIREKQLRVDRDKNLAKTVSDEYRYLGFCHLFASDGKNAEACLRRALQLDPHNTNAKVNLAVALLLQNRVQEARADHAIWKDNPFHANNPRGLTCHDALLSDLNALQAQGIAGIDYETVKKW